MKLTLGAHPTIPFLFSNGPDDPMAAPAERPSGRKAGPRLATKRHIAGQERFSSLLAYWLKRSRLSLRQFCAIVDWGIGEPGWIGSGVLSHMTRGNVQKISIRYLDALAAANHAIWLWQTGGRDQAWKAMGPHTAWKIEDHWLDNAWWLPSPDQPELELDLGDMASVLAGRLELPYMVGVQLTPNEGGVMALELGRLLNDLVAELSLSPRAGIEALLQAYPGQDPNRRELIRDLLLGDTELSSEELQEELTGLAEMIRVIRKVPEGEYGPAELRAELLADRRRY